MVINFVAPVTADRNHREEMLHLPNASWLPAKGLYPSDSALMDAVTIEGFVVEFSCSMRGSWVGNLQPAGSSLNAVVAHPRGNSIVDNGHRFLHGIDGLEVQGEWVTGQGWSPIDDGWHRFRLHRASRAVEGGCGPELRE